MRDYSKVGPKFWIGKTGKALKKKGIETVVVAMYLLTAPHANMLGLYHVPVVYIAHETGLGLEGASKGLRGAIEAGFCAYDEEAEMVWVYEMASYQVAEYLEPRDNRCAGVQREYSDLPENQHLRGFYEKYSDAFHMKNMRDFGSSPEAPLKGLGSQEQEQEQEQDQEQKKTPVEQTPLDPVRTIFEYWQKVMESPGSKLDEKRRRVIVKALKDYSPADVCRAIRGCAKTPHNMGMNDSKTKYNALGLILRSADHIDRFILNDAGQARAAASAETIEQTNARVMAELLGTTAPLAGDIIDMVQT